MVKMKKKSKKWDLMVVLIVEWSKVGGGGGLKAGFYCNLLSYNNKAVICLRTHESVVL